MARTLLISDRGRCRSLGRCCHYECEDVIQSMDDADLLVPAARHRPFPALIRKVLQRVERHVGLRVARTEQVEACEVKGEYDLCFFLLPPWSGGPLHALEYVRFWRSRCRLAVCWVSEAWSGQLREIRKDRFVRTLQQFDLVIVSQAGSLEAMSRLLDRPCRYLPCGIDALAFCPYPDPPARVVDLYNMGRRSPATHAAALDWARRNGRYYLYDTTEAPAVIDWREHRRALAETLKRTKFFLVNRAHVNNPRITAGQEELGVRFFEGAAAGAVMIGEAPRNSPEFNALFGWPDSVIPMRFGATEIGSLIETLEKDPGRLERVRRENVRMALCRFDWLYAWREILRWAKLPPLAGLRERETRLRQMAVLAESSAGFLETASS